MKKKEKKKGGKWLGIIRDHRDSDCVYPEHMERMPHLFFVL
jgi:hypothetical protein